MSHAKLLLSLPPERVNFLHKSYREMHNNASANCDRENVKDYFFSLVKKKQGAF